jgi:hypothetical protein
MRNWRPAWVTAAAGSRMAALGGTSSLRAIIGFTPETDFNPFDPDQCRFDYGTITPSPSIPTPWGSPEDVGLGVDARHAAKAGNNLKRHGESQ